MSMKAVLRMNRQTGQLKPRQSAATYPMLTRALKCYLAMVTTIRRNELRIAGRYASTEELVLFNAKATWADLAAMQLPPMPPKACFDNAFTVAGLMPEYRYTEGYALMDGSIPTHHGWLTGPDGEVADPTWPGMYARHAAREPMKRWSGRTVYMGIAVDRDTHLRWAERTGYPNILAVYDDDVAALLRDGLDALK